jgi:uncharacterized protein YegL
MRKDLTELIFILDKSGSMSGLESDTIGSFNAMLDKQKEADGHALVTTVLFSDSFVLLHDRIDIRGVAPISARDYCVGGCTALLDAIGLTIRKVGNAHKHTAEDQRPGRVAIIITTDGLENASREFSYAKIRQMVQHQQEKYNWEFIFLGANIDAIGAAAQVGIRADRAVDFVADSKGVNLNYQCLSDSLEELRAGRPMPENWKQAIDEDYQKRK